MQPVEINAIEYDYWEGCETGEGDCKPLTFTRTYKNQPHYLFLPGGSLGTVTVTDLKTNLIIQEISSSLGSPPFVLDTTHLPDGNYSLYMISCSLGGPVEIILKTEEE